MLTKKQQRQAAHQLRTWVLTNETNTSTKHKQSIQCSDLNVLVSFLPACIRSQAHDIAHNHKHCSVTMLY